MFLFQKRKSEIIIGSSTEGGWKEIQSYKNHWKFNRKTIRKVSRIHFRNRIKHARGIYSLIRFDRTFMYQMRNRSVQQRMPQAAASGGSDSSQRRRFHGTSTLLKRSENVVCGFLVHLAMKRLEIWRPASARKTPWFHKCVL